MQVKCSKCSRPIALTDVIESINGRLSHIDCHRPATLTSEERQLVFVYCSDHAVAECVACNASYRFMELASEMMGRSRTNLCPQCREDLTDSIRMHLYSCAMAPGEIRRRAHEVRAAAQLLIKESQQLHDTADVLLRRLEAALFAQQQLLRAAMEKRTSR